jgi:sensory rhodopsin
MFVKLLEVQDLASGSFELILFAMLGATVLLLAGTAWAPRKWKLPVALSGIVTLVSALHYLAAGDVWLAAGQMTIIHRYIGWFLTMPLQVVTLFFFVRAVAEVPIGVFWRMGVAAILMVLARFMGETGLMHPTLGFVIALALWLYILGEAFFGAMSERTAKYASAAVQRGYFWMRLILTIGWALYPLCYLIASFSGGVEVRQLIVTYNLADFVNVIAYSLIVLAVAMKEGAS